MEEKVKNKKKYMYGALMIVSALVIVLGGSYLAAKYVHARDSEGSVTAENFYFSSDFLDGEQHTLDAGRTEISFKLGNHGDDLRSADMDVTYKVTVEKTAGEAAGSPTLTNGEGTIAKGAVNDAEVTVSGLEPGCTYAVKAVGKGGYHKTLTAVIAVPAKEEIVYKNVDASDPAFVILTVWAKGYTGAITVSPATDISKALIPDNTDPRMSSVMTGSSFDDAVSFQKDGYASHKYRFFGTGATAEDFDVTYTTSAGEEKQAEEKPVG